MIQAQLKQTVLVLNTETQTQRFDTAVTLSVCVCVNGYLVNNLLNTL